MAVNKRNGVSITSASKINGVDGGIAKINNQEVTAAGGGAYSVGGVTGWAFDFMSDAGTSTTVEDAAVSSWADQSGNGRNATQGDGTKQPIFKSNILNGLPALRFDGVNDCLGLASMDLTGTDAFTLFVIATATAGSDDMFYEFSTAIDSISTGFLAMRTSANKAHAALRGTGYNTFNTLADYSTTFKVLTFLFNKAAGGTGETAIKINNVSNGSSGSSTDNTGNFGNHPSYIGARNNGGSLPLAGDFVRLLGHPTALSSGDQTAVYNALISKYGAL